ncbi:MAG: regulatory protein LuxR [Gammaproteobacteria bacterium]|nr:MAG: regulatory protein LuxR [Gammaproteobacteria bacterium]TND07405.1 MAG: regulatory protein LuxR [Gammaproteobacteria bacterium]
MLRMSALTTSEADYAVTVACRRDSAWFALGTQLLARNNGRLVTALDELLEAIVDQLPRVLVLDQQLLCGDELRYLVTLNETSPETSILLMIDREAQSVNPELMRYGVRGFCRSDVAPDTFAKAVESLLNGALWIPRDLVPALVNQLRVEVQRGGPEAAQLARFRSLTRRQVEVVRMVSDGANNKEIARELGISDRTVKAHLSVVFEKLGISSRLNLALLYNGLKRHDN